MLLLLECNPILINSSTKISVKKKRQQQPKKIQDINFSLFFGSSHKVFYKGSNCMDLKQIWNVCGPVFKGQPYKSVDGLAHGRTNKLWRMGRFPSIDRWRDLWTTHWVTALGPVEKIVSDRRTTGRTDILLIGHK